MLNTHEKFLMDEGILIGQMSDDVTGEVFAVSHPDVCPLSLSELRLIDDSLATFEADQDVNHWLVGE